MSGDRYPWQNWEDGKDRKILVVRLGSLGDVIHAIPAQQALAQNCPQSEIHWLTEPPYAELLRHISGISKVVIADTKAWRKKLSALNQIRKTLREVRRERYDAVFDFQGLLKSALLSRLARSDCVVGLPRSMLRERLSYHFYSCPVEIEEGRRHQIQVGLDLVNPPRHEGPAGAVIPLHIPDKVHASLDKNLQELEICNPILLNPGAGWPTKRWPIERFARLADRIESELRIPVLFTYGPGEEKLISEARATGSSVVRSFPSSILELAALCRRSRLMVAGDTGPMHLAVAVGTPVVALIGPGRTWRTGPFNPEDKVVQHERPCPHPYQRRCSDHFCMDFSVEKVYQAVRERLSLGDMNKR